MSDFVTARIEYISADNGTIVRSNIRAHRITCMREAKSSSTTPGPAVLRELQINHTPIDSSSNTYDFKAGTKIEGFVITDFSVITGNFLVEYLE